MIELTAEENAVLLPVKVVPGASRTRFAGEWNGRAKIVVAAPPEKGKANKAVIALLAERLAIRQRDVTVVTGHGSATKTIRIERISAAAVRAALESERS